MRIWRITVFNPLTVEFFIKFELNTMEHIYVPYPLEGWRGRQWDGCGERSLSWHTPHLWIGWKDWKITCINSRSFGNEGSRADRCTYIESYRPIHLDGFPFLYKFTYWMLLCTVLYNSHCYKSGQPRLRSPIRPHGTVVVYLSKRSR